MADERRTHEDRRLYDISPPISPETPVWPGDTPFRQRRIVTMAEGGIVNLGAFETTVHVGAHVDAPYHLDDEGEPVGSVGLAPYLGPCRLLEVLTSGPVRADELRGRVEEAERVLLRTRPPGAGNPYLEGFAWLEPAVADLLGEEGVLLLGLDTPSVDAFDSRELTVHRALRERRIAILEGLALRGVPEGDYELIALPLPLRDLDGSPVRAVLREL